MVNNYTMTGSQNYKNIISYNQIFNNHEKLVEKNNLIEKHRLTKQESDFGIKLAEDAARKAGDMNFHVSDGTPEPVYVNGYLVTTGAQFEAAFNMKNRSDSNATINNILNENNIHLSQKEKITLTVDKDLRISVSGLEDKEKMRKIETILNSAKVPYGLIYARDLLGEIKSVRDFNGIENPLEVKKFIVYDYIKNEAKQDLNELKLVNGEIVGANDKLKEILKNPPSYEGNLYYESPKWLKEDLKKLLAYGLDKIPDMNRSIDFQKGCLIDKDVQYGFGPEQLKNWFNNLMSGKSIINKTT